MISALCIWYLVVALECTHISTYAHRHTQGRVQTLSSCSCTRTCTNTHTHTHTITRTHTRTNTPAVTLTHTSTAWLSSAHLMYGFILSSAAAYRRQQCTKGSVHKAAVYKRQQCTNGSSVQKAVYKRQFLSDLAGFGLDSCTGRACCDA